MGILSGSAGASLADRRLSCPSRLIHIVMLSWVFNLGAGSFALPGDQHCETCTLCINFIYFSRPAADPLVFRPGGKTG